MRSWYLRRRFRGLLEGLFALAVLGCATVRPPGYEAAQGTVEAGKFIVTAPPADDWGVEVDVRRSRVRFTRLKTGGFPVSVHGATSIAVYWTIYPAAGASGNEQATADAYMANEERIMREEAGKADKAGPEDVRRRFEERQGKRLYVMHWRIPHPWYKGIGYPVEGELYLYFPTTYAEDGGFVQFQIVDGGGWIPSIDLTQVHPVIDSLQIKPRPPPMMVPVESRETSPLPAQP